MSNSFRLAGLDPAPFAPLFRLTDAELKAHHAVRRFADASPGYPCRVSLADADVGDELLLVPYVHQPATSPYRASGPIFVRRGAARRRLAVGELPPYVTLRPISLRAYDAADLMVAAAVAEGGEVGRQLEAWFAGDVVRYVHLHHARQGCFSCRADRA